VTTLTWYVVLGFRSAVFLGANVTAGRLPELTLDPCHSLVTAKARFGWVKGTVDATDPQVFSFSPRF